MIFKLNKDKEIVKTDFQQVYKPQDYVRVANELNKQIREKEANLKLRKKEEEVVLKEFPKIKKIKDQKLLNAIWTLMEIRHEIKMYKDDIKVGKKSQKSLLNEMKEIEKQTKIDFKKYGLQ